MKKQLLVLVVLAAIVYFAAADTVTTTVYFNVPSSISFTVTLPGQSATASGGSSADIEYNASIPTQTKINCTVRPGNANNQTTLVPCFNYSNTGNRALNITLQFGSALPTGVMVKAGHNNSAWAATCTCTDLAGTACNTNQCVEVNDSVAVKVANIAYAGYKEVWMWADFTNYMGGSTGSSTLTHTTQIN